jgi:DNA-binding transcriptional regulator YhcF (GntR family)
MTDSHEAVVDTVRGRVLRGLHAGLLVAGDRLPTSREMAAEFGVDYRVVIAAYKALAAEGLVELRPRGGVYVARGGVPRAGVPPLPQAWLADVLTDALARELPAPELHEWLRRVVDTLRLRAVVIVSTFDQAEGLCRELRDDFGLEAQGLLADEVRASAEPPLPLRRADLVVTTEAHAAWARSLAADLRKPIIVIDVRPELLGGEWALLLRRPVYAVVATPEFGEMLQRFYADVRGVENLHVVVYGRDDVQQIPAGAPTYVTQRVRAQLGDVRIPGRILPAARTISSESARAIFTFIVRSNIEAMSHGAR